MFLENAILPGLNLLFDANPGLQTKLADMRGNVICLEMPFINLKFSIDEFCKFKKSQEQANCIIKVPLAAVSYLLHQEDIKTFQQVKITGNAEIAKEFLMLVKKINFSNVLYRYDSSFTGVIALKAEQLLKSFIEYIKLVTTNFANSGSQYLQYEVDFITDKYLLAEFYAEIDNLTERYDLLTKRVERLLQR